MFKNKRLVNLLQNTALLVLSVSAVFLLTRTTLFSEPARTELAQRFGAETSSSEGSSSKGEGVLSVPLRIVQSSDLVRHGEDALTTSGEAFERVGSFLGEAIGSSYDMETVGNDVFFKALEGSGLYFDFVATPPLELLAARLGVTQGTAQNLDIRRCLLSAGTEDTALFYLYTRSGVCFRCKTAVSAASLKTYLAGIEGNGVSLAGSLQENYAALSPYTLIFGETKNRRELFSANALGDFSTEELLRRAEFNAHTKDRYTEVNGTLVVLEGQRTLRLAPNGTLSYSGDQAAEEDSLYHIPSAQSVSPTRLEAASAAQQLLSSVLAEKAGLARLYLHSMEPVAGGYRLFFDYMVDGTPVVFSDGSHAAEVLTAGNTISNFSLRLRRYGYNEKECLLLPLTQAAAIGSLYAESELSVAYIDTFSDVTHAEWIAN